MIIGCISVRGEHSLEALAADGGHHCLNTYAFRRRGGVGERVQVFPYVIALTKTDLEWTITEEDIEQTLTEHDLLEPCR